MSGVLIPDLTASPDGRPVVSNMVGKPSPELIAYVQSLGQRPEQAQASRGAGGMRPICTDGRKTALDLRLVNLPVSRTTRSSRPAHAWLTAWRCLQDPEAAARAGALVTGMEGAEEHDLPGIASDSVILLVNVLRRVDQDF